MRSILLAGLGSFFAIASTSCSSPGKPLLVDVAWQLTCTGTSIGACLPSMFPGSIAPSFDYRAVNGAVAHDRRNDANLGVLDATCSVTNLGGGNVQLRLSAETDGGSIAISGLNVVRATGAFAGGACRVTAEDGVNRYGGSSAGACSANAPTTGNPCQITNILIDEDHEDGPSIDLNLICTSLPNANLPSVTASVRDSVIVTNPALLHFANCDGL